MMISDAISSASSEHAVYFLVTAFIESLRHFPLVLPERATVLPVTGVEDLTRRLEALSRNTSVSPESRVAASEACAVLLCALVRLSELSDPGVAAPAPGAAAFTHETV